MIDVVVEGESLLVSVIMRICWTQRTTHFIDKLSLQILLYDLNWYLQSWSDTTFYTHIRLMVFFWDYLGEPVPER